MIESLPYIFVLTNIFLALSIVTLYLKNTLIKKFNEFTEFLIIILFYYFGGLLSLIYSFNYTWLIILLITYISSLLLARKKFPNYSFSGLSFYIASIYTTFVGIIWGANFLMNLDVSFMTNILLIGISPLLILAVVPLSIVQLVERYDELCRSRWLRPRHSYPKRILNHEPMVSLHVPTHNEPPEMVIETLNVISKMDYKNFEVIVIDNNTTDKKLWLPLKQHCNKLGKKFKFLHVEGLEGAKAGALNYALKFTDPKATIIGVIDADYHSKPDFIKALIGYFDDPKIGFVQTPHDYRNWEKNIFLRMCYWEYKIFFHSVLNSMHERGAALTVGTMCLIRKKALIDAGGWALWCVTEDSELAIRIHDIGYSSIYIKETFGRGLIPDTFEGFKKQRYRWTAGPVQEFTHHFMKVTNLSKDQSKLTKLQRVHHFSHGLNNVILGLSIPLTILSIFAVVSMVWNQEIIQVPFELWLAATILMFSSVILDVLTYKKIINTPILDFFGKILASKALMHTISLSALKTLITDDAAWNRTNKFKSKYSFKAALYSTKEELIIGLFILVVVTISFLQLPHTGLALMFMIGLFYKSLNYLSSPLTSIISAYSLKKSDSESKNKIIFPLNLRFELKLPY